MSEGIESQMESTPAPGAGILAKAPACVTSTCYEHRGVIFPLFFSPRCLQHLKDFNIRRDDVFVITYPKSGTTWAQQLALLAKYDGDVSFLEGRFIMKEVPFLETLCFDEASTADNSVLFETAPTYCQIADALPPDAIRILKSHALPKFLPDDISSDDPKARVIYVARNPKDAAVSYYHFCKYIKPLPKYDSWEQFFEEFMEDRAPCGSWFENVLHWWNLRDHPNVLFLTYEGMKQDGRKAVEQIATFMGKSFSSDVIDRIAAASTFDVMRKNKSSNPDLNESSDPALDVDSSGNKSFFRKGSIGNWKEYFTDEQNERFDKLYKEKIADTGLEMIFE